MTVNQNIINQEKAEAFKMSIMGMVGGTMAMTTMRLGHELGIFHELAKGGPRGTVKLAEALELSPRYTYEWCLHAASVGILEYDDAKDEFALPPEHALIVDSSEGLMSMICGIVENVSHQYPMLKLAYQTDGGIFWGQMRGMTMGARGFFKPVYEGLMPHWIKTAPSLQEACSQPGAKIADVGCGCGISTKSLAQTFPNSKVLGIDYDPDSIDQCKEELEKAGVTNANAMTADSHTWADHLGDEGSYNVITMFDCFHDMADPEGVAKEALKALKPDGKVFLIEPYSSKEDSTKARLEAPTAPVFAGFSAICCTPCGKVIPGKEGLGTTCGTDRYEKLFTKAGFSSFETFGHDVEGPMNPTAAGFRLMLITK